MTEPFVPAHVDLKDFPFMPIEVHRLLTSETWVLGTGDERAAAMTLWLASWHQTPAGSLPDNDRMLEHLSATRSWKRVRAHALRGWVRCDDGRLHHPVVAEKVLEAWVEKLTQRYKSGAGNQRRWGAEFDAARVIADIVEARRLLAALNPQSRALAKPIPSPRGKESPSDAAGNPTGTPNGPSGTPQGIPERSQGTGTGNIETSTKASPQHSGKRDATEGEVVPIGSKWESVPDGVPVEAWRIFVRHHAQLKRWTLARAQLAEGQCRQLIASGIDPGPVLIWATTRGWSDLVDAAAKMQETEDARCRRRDGESLADAAARELEERIGADGASACYLDLEVRPAAAGAEPGTR